MEGVGLVGLLAIAKQELNVILALRGYLKFGSARKSVLCKIVSLALKRVIAVVKTATDREKHGRVLVPISRITLPDVFLAVL
jgi:hypothetical protein